MARKPYKPDIEYIQKYYSYGSEAKVIEFKPIYKQPKTELPKPKKEKVRMVEIDAVAFCGLMMTIVLVLVLITAVIRFDVACESNQIMKTYLMELQDENVRLNHEYHTGYDIETIEETALALGMIPADQAQTITVQVTVPQPEAEPTLWDDIVWFVTGLFA